MLGGRLRAPVRILLALVPVLSVMPALALRLGGGIARARLDAPDTNQSGAPKPRGLTPAAPAPPVAGETWLPGARQAKESLDAGKLVSART